MNETQNKKVKIELERLINEFGIEKVLNQISLIICAQQNELEKMTAIINKCTDSIVEISNAVTKSMTAMTAKISEEQAIE